MLKIQEHVQISITNDDSRLMYLDHRDNDGDK
jgi:hypothetical protein